MSEIYLVEFKQKHHRPTASTLLKSEIYLVEFKHKDILFFRIAVFRSEIYLVEFKPGSLLNIILNFGCPKSTLWNLNFRYPGGDNRPHVVRNLPCGI